MSKENLVKQLEIWIKTSNSKAIIFFVLDNMLRKQLDKNALTFIQSQAWENIKNLISHEDTMNRNLSFSLLEGQTSTQVRLFFEKSSNDLMEVIKLIKTIVENFKNLKELDKRLEEEQNKLVKTLSEFELKISEAKTQEEKEEYYGFMERFKQAEKDPLKQNIELLAEKCTYNINHLAHKIEKIFEKYDVNLEESQVFSEENYKNNDIELSLENLKKVLNKCFS